MKRPLPADHPRITLKQAIATLKRQQGLTLTKPYLVYALREGERLVWLFVIPHVWFPILGGRCAPGHCHYYADMATIIDATSGKWLSATSLPA